jgi:DNA-binding transcriptional LysR family regulator
MVTSVVRVLTDEALPGERSAPGRGRARGPVREPEVAELRAFCAAASLGSIAEAARSLNVSQPALSKRLRTLEAVVGAELLARSTRGVTLTIAGAHLYSAARRLLASADTVQALMRNPASEAPVHIAASTTVAERRLPEVLAQLARIEASLTIEVVTANSPHVREMVREGRTDLGIAALDPDRPPEDGLMEKVIWRDEVVVLVPADHPWVDVTEIPAAEFAATATVQLDPWSNSSRVVATALDHSGLPRALPYAAIGSSAAVVATARAVGRPALLSLLIAREYEGHGFVVRRVEGMRFDREFALVWTGAVADLPAPVQVVAQYVLDLPFARSRRVGREFAGSST